MVNVRYLEDLDKEIIRLSLEEDKFHIGTTADFFTDDPRAVTTAYEDESGPIMYVKASKAMRIDIQFVENADIDRNKAALHKLEEIVETAKNAGFSELVFCSNSPLLIRYCKRNFGFIEVEGELRRIL